MSTSKLLPPVPPYVDSRHPDVMAMRIEHHHQAIEHLHETRMAKPSASMLRLAALIALYALGGLGLVSPESAAQILKLLLH
jgi:hypothetical protein